MLATLLLVLTAPPAGEQVYDRLVRSTALVGCDGGVGSGVLVHRARRLVLTNDHVIEDWAEGLFVAFALFDGKEPVSDRKQYFARLDKLRRGHEFPPHVRPADIVARRPGKDLALLQIDSVPETARSLRLAPAHAPTGSQVYTVGNSGIGGSNQLWRYTTGNVRGRSTQQTKLLGGERPKRIDSLVTETDLPITPGDSGGPLVNADCQLVGLNCFGNNSARVVSGHIDVEEVRKFLRSAVPDIDWP